MSWAGSQPAIHFCWNIVLKAISQSQTSEKQPTSNTVDTTCHVKKNQRNCDIFIQTYFQIMHMFLPEKPDL